LPVYWLKVSVDEFAQRRVNSLYGQIVIRLNKKQKHKIKPDSLRTLDFVLKQTRHFVSDVQVTYKTALNGLFILLGGVSVEQDIS
jgi:hypothetical protein